MLAFKVVFLEDSRTSSNTYPAQSNLTSVASLSMADSDVYALRGQPGKSTEESVKVNNLMSSMSGLRAEAHGPCGVRDTVK